MPLPFQQRLWEVQQQYAGPRSSSTSSTSSSGGSAGRSDDNGPASDDAGAFEGLPPYYQDWLAAHDALGLVRSLHLPTDELQQQGDFSDNGSEASTPASATTSISGDGGSSGAQERAAGARAWAFASLAPVKDAELIVVGSHLGCPAFKRLLHCALRTFVDGLGIQTFNVGVLNLDVEAPPPAGSSVWANAAGARVAAFCAAAGGVASSNGCGSGGDGAGGNGAAGVPRAPVVARIVGRGKLGSAASDYGCLEVFGGASIGHTDPYAVMTALDRFLEGGMV